MAKLVRAAQALASVLNEACPTQQVTSLTADGEGQVVLQFTTADDKKVVLNLVFFEADQYPRSGVLIQLDEDRSSCTTQQSEKLTALSERFQDTAQLCAVLSKVCDVLGIPLNEEPLRAAEKKAASGSSGSGGGSGADEAAGSDMEAEEDDDVSAEAMSEDYPSSDDGSGGGYDDDDGLADDEDDKELLVECGQRQGRWTRYEDDLAAANATQQALSMEQGKASKQQIFSSQEAFKMLSNELLGFVRRQSTGQDMNVSADSAGDDLYTWNVWLWKTAFKPECQLAKDLQEVSSKFAVSSIQLRFTFMRGLHPFYPPRLEVVRPHLTTPLPGALASYPLLQLKNWDSCMNMSQLIDNIRGFLEAHGSIDVSHPRNSEAVSPASAFSPVQLALARLEAMTSFKPACHDKYKELYEARSKHADRPESAIELEPIASSPTALQQAKKPRTAQAENTGTAAAGSATTTAAAKTSGGGGATAGTATAAAAANKDVVWAKGTGYGYGGGFRNTSSGPVWDAKAAAAAQEAHDEQLRGLLQDLAAALRHELLGESSEVAAAAVARANGDAAPAAAAAGEAQAGDAAAGTSGAKADAGDGDGSETSGSKGEADEAAAAAGPSSRPEDQQQQLLPEPMDAGPTADQQECLSAVKEGVLLPLLARELSQVAFSEIVDRHQYFRPLLSVLDALCNPLSEQLLAGNALSLEPAAAAAEQAEHVCSVVGAVRGLQKSTTMYKDRMGKVLQQQKDAASASASSSTFVKVDRQAEALQQQAQRSLDIAHQLLSITQKLQHLPTAEEAAAAAAAKTAATPPPQQHAAPRTRRATRSSAAAAAAAAAAVESAAGENAAGSGPSGAGSAAAYVASLKPLVLDSARIAAFHKFKGDAELDPMGLKARVQRVTSEMAGIERLIEVNESSSIFVRIDDDNSFLWRVLITGPEDTPYSGGAFVFDMFFPPTYPSGPPKVLLVTTGGGTVRFNPNLYNCGKVCLSLLGTWSGGQGESWNPEASSAFQVLVSIQSLILVPEPYFNEPGYEQRGDKAASNQYNQAIREASMRWAMIDQLKNPPAEFADVIKTHFKLRGSYILKQTDGWIQEAGSSSHGSKLKDLKKQLEAELAKLT